MRSRRTLFIFATLAIMGSLSFFIIMGTLSIFVDNGKTMTSNTSILMFISSMITIFFIYGLVVYTYRVSRMIRKYIITVN